MPAFRMNHRLSWALSAFHRAARPLVRLALGLGLKHAQLEEALRDLLLDEARRAWRERGVAHPNVSQLSVTTGLNRKAVAQRMHAPADALPHTEASLSAYCFTLWRQVADQDPTLLRLPVSAVDGPHSFEALARRATRGNLHYRTVLDEMIRLGLVIDHGTQVQLAAEAFVPSRDLQSLLAFLGDNGRDHLLAATANTLAPQPLFLERAVFAGGLDEAACHRVQALTRERWNALHQELVATLGAAVDEAGGAGDQRIRIGIYTYHEHREPPPPPDGTAPQPGRPSP